MLSRISSKELTEWLAFYELEPFGSEADYLGHAVVASVIANVNKAKGQKPFSVEDFMPKRNEGSGVQTEAEMIQIASMFTLGLGGQDLREDSDG